MGSPSCVALIPARSGSKRAPGKNIRELAGHPLLAYAIAAARKSGVFDRIIVSSDSPEYLTIAKDYGATGLVLRPAAYATDTSPDFEWVQHLMHPNDLWGPFDAFAILRPTSPFRTAATICRAWAQFVAGGSYYDSLRAVEPVKQHPGKMWRLRAAGNIDPFWDTGRALSVVNQPFHSSPTQVLPKLYVQNASLEIAWTRVLTQHQNISGERVMPFFTTEGREGFDINSEDDWALAEHLIATGQASLPEVHRCP